MAYQPAIETTTTDILILGSGGAGLFAALHAYDANPRASILITVKGLLGKSGCTRMVQGGVQRCLASPGFARAALPGHDCGGGLPQ